MVDILVALQEVFGLKNMQTGLLPHAVRRHAILDAQHDHLAGIALSFMALLGGTNWCKTCINRKLDVGITRCIGLPEGIISRQTCSDSNLLRTKIKIGESYSRLWLDQ